MTSLEKKVLSYKSKMSKETFEVFKKTCSQSINLNAKNTKNHQAKYLAEHQIEILAKRHISNDEKIQTKILLKQL